MASHPRENEDNSAMLSPATAAVAQASVQVAARTSDVQTGALRIRGTAKGNAAQILDSDCVPIGWIFHVAFLVLVLRVTDLPGPALNNGQSTSWLRRRPTVSSKNKSDAESRTVAVVLKTKTSGVMVSETAAWADDVTWNEVS